MREETFRREFGLRLKLLRERAGLSQNDLKTRVYEKSGIKLSVNRISNWENGLGIPSVAYTKAICAALYCTFEEFFGNSSTDITAEEFQMLIRYRKLDEAGKYAVDAIIDSQLYPLSTTAQE